MPDPRDPTYQKYLAENRAKGPKKPEEDPDYIENPFTACFKRWFDPKTKMEIRRKKLGKCFV
jgi:hypothetical protein